MEAILSTIEKLNTIGKHYRPWPFEFLNFFDIPATTAHPRTEFKLILPQIVSWPWNELPKVVQRLKIWLSSRILGASSWECCSRSFAEKKIKILLTVSPIQHSYQMRAKIYRKVVVVVVVVLFINTLSKKYFYNGRGKHA